MAAVRIRIVTRLGGRGKPLPSYLLGSALGHAVFIAALVLVPALGPQKPLLTDAIAVELVMVPGPPGPPAARTPAPPPPEDAPTPEVARLETREPPAPKPLPENPKPKPEKPKPEKPKPEPQQPAPAPAPQDPGPPAEEPAAAPGTPAGAGGRDGAPDGSSVALEGVDAAFAWYRDSVQAAIKAHWRRPVLDGLGATLEVRVAFEVQRDGSVRGLTVTHPSGVPTFDRSAMSAVLDAAPLPPLPAQWPEPPWAAGIVFRMPPE